MSEIPRTPEIVNQRHEDIFTSVDVGGQIYDLEKLVAQCTTEKMRTTGTRMVAYLRAHFDPLMVAFVADFKRDENLADEKTNVARRSIRAFLLKKRHVLKKSPQALQEKDEEDRAWKERREAEFAKILRTSDGSGAFKQYQEKFAQIAAMADDMKEIITAGENPDLSPTQQTVMDSVVASANHFFDDPANPECLKEFKKRQAEFKRVMAVATQKNLLRNTIEATTLGLKHELAQALEKLTGLKQVLSALNKGGAERITSVITPVTEAYEKLETAWQTTTASLQDLETRLREGGKNFGVGATGAIEVLSGHDWQKAFLASWQTALKNFDDAYGAVLRENMHPKNVATQLTRESPPALPAPESTALIHRSGTYETIVTREAARPIGEIIAEDAASYAAKGLTTWAAEVRTLTDRWRTLSATERAYLEQKRREGQIVIGMPSAQTQLRTMQPAVDALRPLSGADRTIANETAFWWDYPQNLITKKDPVLTRNIPNHPYFFWFQPSERPPADSLNKTSDEQKQWVKDLHAADHHLFAIQLAEDLAAQTRLTEKGAEPMDAFTWTRLIELPQHGGGVVGVRWYSGYRKLWVFRGDEYAYSDGGVRLAGRV